MAFKVYTERGLGIGNDLFVDIQKDGKMMFSKDLIAAVTDSRNFDQGTEHVIVLVDEEEKKIGFRFRFQKGESLKLHAHGDSKATVLPKSIFKDCDWLKPGKYKVKRNRAQIWEVLP